MVYQKQYTQGAVGGTHWQGLDVTLIYARLSDIAHFTQ